MAELGESYKRRYADLRRAMRELRSMLREIEAAIEDRALVRAQVSGFRIKELPSLVRKAGRNGWKGEEAFSQCGDLIGGRVICNNTEDVYRFAELLRERLPGDRAAFEVQDWIKKPNERGYRALHVNFRLNVSKTLAPELVPCEVQIRTRLQDAWAELTHGDIYKQPELPEDLRERSSDLASILATADNIASSIRRRAIQEAIAPKERPDLRSVSSVGLAFAFGQVFGRLPPDYLVRQALNLCEELQIASLERLPGILGQGEFRDELGEAYHSIMGVRIGSHEVFLASIQALGRGQSQAVNYVKRKARREFREIDRIARREMLSSLPDSVEELIAQLEDPRSEANVESWAEALEATDNCSVCGTTIVGPHAFAEAVVQHYGPENSDDVRARIETAVYQSSVDIGGWGKSTLCSYHDDRADKE